MKRIGAAILLFIFTLQFAYSAIVITWYYVNQAYVARVLCVNKNNPKMACHGKCYLNKKLSQSTGTGDKEAPLQVKKPVETAPCILEEFQKPNLFYSLHKAPYGVFTEHYQFTLSPEIFHTPAQHIL